MKKLKVLLLSLLLIVTMLFSIAAPAFAQDKAFSADFFPNGKIQTPEAPYIKQTNLEGKSTKLEFFCTQPSELQRLAFETEKHEETSFSKKYSIAQLNRFCQLDVKFNNGQWLSENENWDAVSEVNDALYGKNINGRNPCCVLYSPLSTADRMHHFTQMRLISYDENSPTNTFLKPYVEAVKGVEENEYIIDFSQTTITYRFRWCVKYLENLGSENEKWVLIKSDWSPESSFGKNSNLVEPIMPENIDAPVISDFNFVLENPDMARARLFVNMPDSVADAECYQIIVKDNYKPYYIDTQLKINDGDWFSFNDNNQTALCSGIKAFDVFNAMNTFDDAWIRLRVCKSEDNSALTEWSNILNAKLEAGEYFVIKETPTEQSESSKNECKLCGACPIQPLGICLFVWIAVAALFVFVISIIAYFKKNKNH